jgi:hypothetical protein
MVTLFLIIGLYAGNLEYFVGPLSLRLPPLGGVSLNLSLLKFKRRLFGKIQVRIFFNILY